MLCNDGVFTPVSNCRFFDFTIDFSNTIFVSLPSAVATTLFLARLVQLHRRSKIWSSLRISPLSDMTSLSSTLLAFLNSLLNLALLIILVASHGHGLWHAMDASTALPATMLACIAALLALPLTIVERRARKDGSMLLPLWLLFSLFFSACRIRTLNAIPDVHSSAFFAIYIVTFACQALLLALDNAEGPSNKGENSTRETRAPFFSRLFFIWVFPMLRKGLKQPLEMHELEHLQPDYYGQWLAKKFFHQWTGNPDEESSEPGQSFDMEPKHLPKHQAYPMESLQFSTDNQDHPGKVNSILSDKSKVFPNRHAQRSILSTTLRAFWSSALAPVPWRILLASCMLAQPFLVSTTLAFVQSYSSAGADAQPVVYGWGLVGAYAFVYLGQTLATGQYWYTTSQFMTKIRGAYVEAIFRKGLSLHLRIARTSGGGKAANLMSVDSERVVESISVFHDLWSGILVVGVGIYILYTRIGLVFLASLAAVFVCFLLTPLTSLGLGIKQGKWSAEADKRVNLTSSITADIKGVKFSAYEDILSAKLQKMREEELRKRGSMMKQYTAVLTFTNCAGQMMGIATFVTLIIVDKLSGSKRFDLNTVITTLTVFNVIEEPLFQLGQQYATVLQALASLKRIEDFLESEERPDAPASAGAGQQDRGYAAKFEEAGLGWGEDSVLSGVNLEIPTCALTMVSGRISEGKSTLLQAILGESDLLCGHRYLPLLEQRVAYVSQDIWLQEKRSLRENVVFPSDDHDHDRYLGALRSCALIEDVENLQHGDSTLASALSGGQRQRVAIARAIYSNAEAYVFDDIFSALDAETAAHIWRSLLGPAGVLKGKTVIMATNAVHLLQHAHLVIRLEAGTVAESASFEKLSSQGKQAISSSGADEMQHTPTPSNQDSKEQQSTASGEQDEAVMSGAIGAAVYGSWFRAAGLGNSLIFFLCCAMTSAAMIGPSYFLQSWSELQQSAPFHEWRAWTSGYALLSLLPAVFLGIGFWVLAVTCGGAAGRELHAAELKGVLSASLAFFDKWTSGQIINRFSQDLFILDAEFIGHLTNMFFSAFGFIAVVVTMIVPAPYLAVFAVALLGLACSVRYLYIPTSRQLRRLEMASKSPLYTLFWETSSPAGLATIRGLKCEAQLAALNTARLDRAQTPYYHLFIARRWLQTWLLLLTTTLNVMLVLLVVVLRHSSRAGVFGVALVQATQLGTLLNGVIIATTETEIAGVALERIKTFSEIEPEESSSSSPENIDAEPIAGLGGEIEFDRVSVAYNPHSTPAVSELSFRLSAGRRLGFVGRSGSGKSTALLALFRMLPTVSGDIFLSSRPISSINLRTLRSSMSIIPQVPLILATSVRENLDPEHAYPDDSDLWVALSACHLADFVKSLPNKLDEVLLSGETFISPGQKQLLALARAVLRKRKVLVLDEATSSMDEETDDAIQEVLEKEFRDVTVIAVAHRVRTVMRFDEVIVMEKGRAVEKGSPQELVKRGGEFFALAREQGCV